MAAGNVVAPATLPYSMMPPWVVGMVVNGVGFGALA
jgi:hypothetical protein